MTGRPDAPQPSREFIRQALMAEITKRGRAADIGVWSAPSGSTGLSIVGIAADVALEAMGYTTPESAEIGGSSA